MKLLIVDDEQSAIDAVLTGVDWKKLKFSDIYTASDKKEAIRIIEQKPVDILLCDIEMPQGSGLELLEWINANHRGICCIFMTCHADFSYAQRALHLGSFEYILKPLDFENLENVLSNAITRVAQFRQLETANTFWNQGKAAVEKQFWRKLFIGDIVADDENIASYISRHQLDIPVDGLFLPVFISPKRFPSDMSVEDIKLFSFALRNIAEELFMTEDTVHQVEDFRGNEILVVFTIKSPDRINSIRSHVEALCWDYRAAADDYFHIQVCCYLGEPVSISGMPAEIEIFHQIDYNNVILWRNVIDFRSRAMLPDPAAVGGLDFSRFTVLLGDGRYDDIVQNIREVLEADPDQIRDRQFLEQFFRGFDKLLGNFSSKNLVSLGELFDNEKNVRLTEAAETSADGLLRWVDYVMDILGSFKKNRCQPVSPVDRVCLHIQQHLEDTLSVDEIADSVHLNPDYLNRVFKKEKGMSLNKYVILQKMERAKWLLRHTNWKIGDVAAAVGYYNYSSFNRAFAKVVGQSPQAWKHREEG